MTPGQWAFVLAAAAVAVNLWVVLWPDGNASDQSQALWGGGFAAGCAWAILCNWWMNLPRGEEADAYDDRVEEFDRLVPRPVHGGAEGGRTPPGAGGGT